MGKLIEKAREIEFAITIANDSSNSKEVRNHALNDMLKKGFEFGIEVGKVHKEIIENV